MRFDPETLRPLRSIPEAQNIPPQLLDLLEQEGAVATPLTRRLLRRGSRAIWNEWADEERAGTWSYRRSSNSILWGQEHIAKGRGIRAIAHEGGGHANVPGPRLRGKNISTIVEKLGVTSGAVKRQPIIPQSHLEFMLKDELYADWRGHKFLGSIGLPPSKYMKAKVPYITAMSDLYDQIIESGGVAGTDDVTRAKVLKRFVQKFGEERLPSFKRSIARSDAMAAQVQEAALLAKDSLAAQRVAARTAVTVMEEVNQAAAAALPQVRSSGGRVAEALAKGLMRRF